MNCQNCGSKLSCGCQKRVASDGKEVCSTCASNYENQIKLQNYAANEEKVNSLNAQDNKTNNT